MATTAQEERFRRFVLEHKDIGFLRMVEIIDKEYGVINPGKSIYDDVKKETTTKVFELAQKAIGNIQINLEKIRDDAESEMQHFYMDTMLMYDQSRIEDMVDEEVIYETLGGDSLSQFVKDKIEFLGEPGVFAHQPKWLNWRLHTPVWAWHEGKWKRGTVAASNSNALVYGVQLHDVDGMLQFNQEELRLRKDDIKPEV